MPQDIWGKATGDLNDDGLADLLASANNKVNSLTRQLKVLSVNDTSSLTGIEKGDQPSTVSADAAQVSYALRISNPDKTNLQHALATITNNYKYNEDLLYFPFGTMGISSNCDASTGFLNLSCNNAVAGYQEAFRNTTYQNKKITNLLQGIRIISSSVNDAEINIDISERNIGVLSENAAPLLSGIEQFPVKYMINSKPVNITQTLQITSSDENNLQSASIHIAKNYKIGEDQLTAINPDSLTTYFNSSSGSLLITGTAPAETYQLVIRSIVFSSTNTEYNSGTRRLDISVSDGKLTSNMVSRDIEIENDQTPPALENMEIASLPYFDKNAKLNLTNSIVINSAESQTITHAEVRITDEYVPGEDELLFNDMSNITGSFDRQKGLLALAGEASAFDYQQALRNVEYQNSSDGTSSLKARVTTFVVWNKDLKSNTSSRKIVFSAKNRVPILGEIEGVQLIYENGGTSVSITKSLSFIDLDDNYMTGATIDFTSNYHQGEDLLEFENTGTITGNFNINEGTMTIRGVDTKEHYKEALRQVKYKNTKGISNYSSGVRVVSFSLNDGQGVSNLLARNIVVSIITLDHENGLISGFNIYPNPFSGYVTIQFLLNDPSPIEAEILDINGKIIYKEGKKLYNPGEVIIRLNLQELKQGIYLLRFKIGREWFTKKIISTP